ncbi:MAG: DeoR/GlpR family DNA-binding transcription regulator [Propionibacteriaceae bacterium]|jgi:DeoR/GlpR family transcriptional regulator of sugar metabolism|nr:DeoR/GlpR family DNA-binding transcription regulator [Propionibacteriaceae bacterium]
MTTVSRRKAIVRSVRANRQLSVDELAGEMDVSVATIRRDLDDLSAKGLLRRVRGGAEAVELDPSPFEEVALIHADDKDAVARRGAELVHDGDIVLLDIGTTVAQLANHLLGKRITLITSSLEVVRRVEDDPGIEVVVLGGLLRRTYHSLAGALTESALRQLRADICFLSTSGVHPSGRVLDNTGMELPIKQAMLSAADQIVLMADRGKFPGPGVMTVCEPDQITTLITNKGASEETLEVFRQAGTEVITI